MPDTSEAFPSRTSLLHRARLPFISAVIFSFVYFFEVLTRASEKLFWYDELVTVYFSRLSLHALWPALNSGVDFNPPLFYVLTRAAEGIWGEGPIGTRMPEILGFWVFCVSLFIFVSRCAGYLAGAVALTFPTLTGAFYYAYEARPHGIVLGCCGLALLFWQSALERPDQHRWLIGFSLSLFSGFMLHCYALLLVVPFACTELFLHRARIRWSFWVALFGPAIPAVLLYAPLLISYKKTTQGTPFAVWFPASWSKIEDFYAFLLYPHLLLVMVVLVVLLIDRVSFLPQTERNSIQNLPSRTKELSLAVSFLFLPAFGILLARVVHGPFFDRYFQSALAGFCILLGLGMAARGVRYHVAVVVAVLTVGALGFDFCKLAWHRYQGWPERLNEPSTGWPFVGTPQNPLLGDPLLAAQKDNRLPIIILNPLYYLNDVHYSPELADRLFCALPSRDHISYRILRSLREYCGVKCNPPMTYSEFRSAHPDFLIYGDLGMLAELPALEGNGHEVGRMALHGGNFLVEVNVPTTTVTRTP